MPKGLNDTQKAQMLTNQLSEDLAALNGNEPSLSEKNGPQGKTQNTTEIVSNSRAMVNANIDKSAKTADVTGGWDEPIPLESSVAPPPFPIHCLPKALREYALAVAEHTQTPIDMAAVASLGASSACLQGKYRVQGKKGYTVPLNNYYLIAAKPAERKSPVCSAFEEPITAYENHHNKTFALEIAQSQNILQVLEKELEALKNAAAKSKSKSKSEDDNSLLNPYAEIEAKQAEIHNHEEIRPLRLMCGGDVSPEALTSLLADNNGKMAMFSAEGGIFSIL